MSPIKIQGEITDRVRVREGAAQRLRPPVARGPGSFSDELAKSLTPDCVEDVKRRESDDRAEKLRLIKDQIKNGTYKTDVREIAVSLLMTDMEPLL